MPPSNVEWTPMLEESLGNDQAKINQLVADFLEWKNGDEDAHKVFGRDGRNRDELDVRHVHLMPVSNPAERKKWVEAYKKFRKRTSNIYLIYADGTPTHGYLLIDVLHDDDPGAHAIWDVRYKPTRSIWQAMANQFKFSAVVPTMIPENYATTNAV